MNICLPASFSGTIASVWNSPILQSGSTKRFAGQGSGLITGSEKKCRLAHPFTTHTTGTSSLFRSQKMTSTLMLPSRMRFINPFRFRPDIRLPMSLLKSSHETTTETEYFWAHHSHSDRAQWTVRLENVSDRT